MSTQLTSRERVNRAMEHRPHDRIPRHDSFWKETIERWEQEGLTGGETAALKALGSDFQSLTWCWPVPFPGDWKLLAEDAETKVLRDDNGATVRYWKNKSGTPEHLGWECDSPEVWLSRFKPAFVNQSPRLDVSAVRERYAKARAEGKWVHLTGVEAFEVTRRLIGDVGTMMGIIDHPEWIQDVAETCTDALIRNYESILAAGLEPDGLWTFGDMAFNHSTFCSPAAYEAIIWPSHRRLCDWAHRHGMKFIYHTDGHINQVLDLYDRAGFDCLQPLEAKAGVDIRLLAGRYGSRFSFFGNIDIMKMIPNDRDILEEEVASKLAAGMAGQGYIYHSDHSVPPQVSWATYRELIGFLERYGNYR